MHDDTATDTPIFHELAVETGLDPRTFPLPGQTSDGDSGRPGLPAG